jgi:hypothetical protein
VDLHCDKTSRSILCLVQSNASDRCKRTLTGYIIIQTANHVVYDRGYCIFHWFGFSGTKLWLKEYCIKTHNQFHCYNLFSTSDTLVTTVCWQVIYFTTPFEKWFHHTFLKGSWQGLIFISDNTLMIASRGCQLWKTVLKTKETPFSPDDFYSLCYQLSLGTFCNFWL